MTIHQDAREPVVRLDLRTDAHRLRNRAELHEYVLDQLGQAGLPEPDDYRFLVVDSPAGLLAHESAYEHIVNYRAVGEVFVLCLLVGGLPASPEGTPDAERHPADRVLVRPAMLRSTGVGVLWAGDLRAARTAADRTAPDDPGALAVLVDLLTVPTMFNEVLDALGSVPGSVAAPGVRLLEQDLAEDVRDRAWREALLRFAGDDIEGSPGRLGRPEADLPKPLADLVVGLPGQSRQHRAPGGDADTAYRRCSDALRTAGGDLVTLASLRGLLGPGPRLAFEEALREVLAALEEYRGLAEQALGSEVGTGGPLSGPDTAARMARLGLRVAPSEGAGERVGEGLRLLTERLLTEGKPLRSAAQRFTRLSGEVEPLPAVALLPRLAEHTPARVLEHASLESGRRAAPAPWRLAVLCASGALGALWSWPLVLLALLVPALVSGGVQLSAIRQSRSTTARARARLLGGSALCGAVLGAVGGLLERPPVWVGSIGLLLGLGFAVALLLHGWQADAYAWGRESGLTAAQDALEGLDSLLAEAVRELWAAEERLYCADAARSIAGVLRATADAAQAEATGGESGGSRSAAPGRPIEPDDDWLSRTPFAEADTLNQSAGADPVDGDADWAEEFAWDRRPRPSQPASGNGTVRTARQATQQAEPDTRPVQSPRWLDQEAGEGGPDLVATLAGDLTDAAVTALGPYLGAVERGEAAVAAQDRIAASVRSLLAVARTHLRHNGVVPAPPFASPLRGRPASANLLGISSLRVAEAAGSAADRQGVTQLCTPEQSTLLNRDPAKAVWLRFAPRAVREELIRSGRGEQPDPDVRVAWTSSGRYAGLLRLMPLRNGVVLTVRPRQREEDQW